MKFRNCITISNAALKWLAKTAHVPFALPSTSDPERGHVLVTHSKQDIASGIIKSLSCPVVAAISLLSQEYLEVSPFNIAKEQKIILSSSWQKSLKKMQILESLSPEEN